MPRLNIEIFVCNDFGSGAQAALLPPVGRLRL
jgi:hypothetical protein